MLAVLAAAGAGSPDAQRYRIFRPCSGPAVKLLDHKQLVSRCVHEGETTMVMACPGTRAMHCKLRPLSSLEPPSNSDLCLAALMGSTSAGGALPAVYSRRGLSHERACGLWVVLWVDDCRSCVWLMVPPHLHPSLVA